MRTMPKTKNYGCKMCGATGKVKCAESLCVTSIQTCHICDGIGWVDEDPYKEEKIRIRSLIA